METRGVLAENLRGHSSAEFPELIGTIPNAVRISTPNLMIAKVMPMAPLLGPRLPDLSVRSSKKDHRSSSAAPGITLAGKGNPGLAFPTRFVEYGSVEPWSSPLENHCGSMDKTDDSILAFHAYSASLQ